jgi:hypothetical protein
MPQIARFLLLLSGLVAMTGILACSTEPNRESLSELRIRTDKTAYSKSLDQSVEITVVNEGSFRVYAPMGEYVHIEQWSENGWINQGPWFFVDGVGRSFPIEAGDTHVPLGMDLDYIARAGTYRFIFYLSFDPSLRRPVHLDERVSNEFQVVW